MIKVVKDIQLTKNFKLSEFKCKDGSNEVKLDMELVNRLQKLRELAGLPIRIMSGYRNHTYNVRIGGALFSQHIYGKAADIHIGRLSSTKMLELVRQMNWIGGIGVYDTWVHVDTRTKPAFWDKRTS